MVSRYPQRYPDPQNDERPAEAELAKSLRILRFSGERAGARTRDPLIKSPGPAQATASDCWRLRPILLANSVRHADCRPTLGADGGRWLLPICFRSVRRRSREAQQDVPVHAPRA